MAGPARETRATATARRAAADALLRPLSAAIAGSIDAFFLLLLAY
jgi:hypothetical protein